jgi:hypothetical protein
MRSKELLKLLTTSKMKTGNITEIAIGVIATEKELSRFQKEVGMASVIPKVGVANYIAKEVNYLEDDRYVSLQRHELKKELYLREMRSKPK